MSKQTSLHPKDLIVDGFREIIFEGRFYYIKNHIAVTYDGFAWRPCNLDFGRPYTTSVYINNLEELHRLMAEGLR